MQKLRKFGPIILGIVLAVIMIPLAFLLTGCGNGEKTFESKTIYRYLKAGEAIGSTEWQVEKEIKDKDNNVVGTVYKFVSTDTILKNKLTVRDGGTGTLYLTQTETLSSGGFKGNVKDSTTSTRKIECSATKYYNGYILGIKETEETAYFVYAETTGDVLNVMSNKTHAYKTMDEIKKYINEYKESKKEFVRFFGDNLGQI